ncbi:hypothetical protein ACH5RR_013177 [Cinchona calisaya]|uniref:Uncharacterized protein n=1 Tax=Cinchona calisaya TaxID=153742 RepID=A0ABD3A2P9_9GENT
MGIGVEVYLRAKIEEVIMKKLKVNEYKSTRVTVDSLKDKDDLRRERDLHYGSDMLLIMEKADPTRVTPLKYFTSWKRGFKDNARDLGACFKLESVYTFSSLLGEKLVSIQSRELIHLVDEPHSSYASVVYYGDKQICGSSINSPDHDEYLSINGKLVYFRTLEMIKKLSIIANNSSFLASALSWKGLQRLVV